MTVNKPHTPVASDADRDEAPELTSEFFERAEVRDGENVIREASGTLTKRARGRPSFGAVPKEQVTLRLAPEVLDFFRGGRQHNIGMGPSLEAALREHIERVAPNWLADWAAKVDAPRRNMERIGNEVRDAHEATMDLVMGRVKAPPSPGDLTNPFRRGKRALDL